MSKLSLIIVGILFTIRADCQFKNDTIDVAGIKRTFHFIEPASKMENASLIFVLHGSGGTGKQVAQGAQKLQAISKQENILLVYPDGYKNYWNECRKAATSAANVENIDEGTFFSLMIDYFTKKYYADPQHVFVVGTSGGGHMAYKLAMTMPQKIKAITAIIANLPDSVNMDCTAANVPVSVMIINGTSDPVNPYLGGEVKITGAYLGTVRSTEETFKYWTRLNGFSGKPKETTLPDTDPNDGKTIVRYSFEQKGKPSAVLLKVVGGKHDYPNDIDVYLEAWKFFKQEIKQTTP